MDVSSQLLFFFSALGVFNALLICFYFFFYKKPKHYSNYFFGLLLLMLAIRVGKSVFFYFNDNLSRTFLQVGITACFFIGPALYFYLKSVVCEHKSAIKNWKYHFGFLFIVLLAFGIKYPWSTYPKLWFTQIVGYVYWFWFIYLLASAYILLPVLKKIIVRKEKINALDFWLMSVFFGNLIIWIAYKTVAYTSYIVGALSFSFIFYLLFLLIHFKRRKISIFSSIQKYANKKIEADEAELLIQNLKDLMQNDSLHRDANLKLQDVAKKMNIMPHRLSQLLNDNLNISFIKFVNEHRIKEAKDLIKTNDKLTFEAIGFECGFNSKSTFYSAFKRNVGLTPAQYKTKI